MIDYEKSNNRTTLVLSAQRDRLFWVSGNQQHMFLEWELNGENQGSNFSLHTRKMQVKKQLEVVFSLLAFSGEWKFGAFICGSYPRYKSSLQFP